MSPLIIIAIVISSILTYIVITGLLWGITLRVVNPPKSCSSSSGQWDQNDWGICAAFWPITYQFIGIFWIFMFAAIAGNFVAGIIAPGMKTKSVKPVKQEPVLCDVCRSKIQQGVYR